MASRSLIPTDHAILLYPKLACAIGVWEAVVLHQLSFLIDNPRLGEIHNGHPRVYFTHEELRRQYFPFMSISTLTRAIDSLVGQRLLNTEPRFIDNYKAGLWYSINETGAEIITEERYRECIEMHRSGRPPRKILQEKASKMDEEGWPTSVGGPFKLKGGSSQLE